MTEPSSTPHRRRVRYSGKNPRRFEEKYKELAPEKYPETVAKVLSSGKTPAGMHRPIMVAEILEILAPRPGQVVIDCTLGYGGHTREILPLLQPGGRLIGLDVDPIEQPKTEARLRALGFGEDVFTVRRSNFAGLPKVLATEGLTGVDAILADLGVSSMQLDTPDRGFSVKNPGPLDMRMNPHKGQSAADLLKSLSAADFADLLRENSDEPRAALLAQHLAGRSLALTTDLTRAIETALANVSADEQEKSVRRVFQTLRIAVNEEFTALDTLLKHIPRSLNSGGRVAILTFHSGEDRRVKKAFEAAHHEGLLSEISDDVIRASAAERGANPRAASAKLRWAQR
jgi:16S rRNA (cytosine1402-N4)-methyltransferase